ncbi:MAG TPA: hypothetical protein VH482_32785 [Thermomicrobiales bacterium]|jgi:hypothetical protein
MKLAVLGDAAGAVGAVAKRHPGVSEVVTIEADAALTGGEWLGIVVSSETDGCAHLARRALASGLRVLLVGIPSGDVWRDLAVDAPDGLTLSRPLRFDPHIARAKEVVGAGTIGTPRTLEIGWSFGDQTDATAAAGELVDVACHLLADTPASIYAVVSDVAGPPVVKVNLLGTNGALAVIEAAVESADLPTRRDLHLLATDGEIVHRIGNDDLLWSDGRVEPLPGATGNAELLAREIDAWIDGGSASERLARGTAAAWNLAVARALSRSLATGEMVAIGEEVGGS